MFLKNRLEELRLSGQLIGFCPWADGDGTLVGRVLEVDDRQVRFQLVGATGLPDGQDPFDLDSIVRLDEFSDYVNRLALLAPYAVAESDGEEATSADEITSWLEEAVATGEVVDVTRIDESRRECRVIRVADGWVDLEILADDPRVVENRVACRLELVTEVGRRSGVLRAVNELVTTL